MALITSCANQPSPVQGTTSPPSSAVYAITVVASTQSALASSCTNGTTAYVQSPVGLFTCQVGKWVPIACLTVGAGAVAYASATQTLLACVQGQWTPVALPAGPQGPAGSRGATGAQGDAGATALVTQAALPAGGVCPYGGIAVSSGVDKNGDGQLQSGEVTSTNTLCNGAPGSDVKVTAEPAGPNCAAGGERIDIGLPADGGVAVQKTAYVCNGAMGVPGPAGPPGPQGDAGATELVASAPEPAGANCSAGGVAVTTGLDLNHDGTLEASEVTTTSYVCNGQAGQTIGPGGQPVASFTDTVCDPTAAPNTAQGVFVDPLAGDDVMGTGGPDAPLKTLGPAVSLAVALSHASLYLAEGTYASNLTLPAGSVLFVEGGWTHSGGSWHRDCSAGVQSATVINGIVESQAVSGGLRSLTVHSTGGFSNVAVQIATGKFTLWNVVASAGAGQNGTPGSNGAAGLAGSGTLFGQCSGGVNGTPGKDGAPSTGGTFLSDGSFAPGNGQAGMASSSPNGTNGAAGNALFCEMGAGCQAQFYTDSYSCNCGIFGGCDTCYQEVFNGCSYILGTETTVSAPCGAAGQAGGAGGVGQGGGASVAVTVGSTALVNIVGSALTAANGGNGAPGGTGGPGGVGSPGASETVSCANGCIADTSAETCTVAASSQTSQGGKGGNGAAGTSGGAGAGGPSYALVKVGAATVSVDSLTTFAFGMGGLGAAGAANGAAGATAALP